MISGREYLSYLDALIGIETISPMTEAVFEQTDRFLREFDLKREAGNDFWVRRCNRSTTWVYAHVDVKPPGDVDRWFSPPFKLTERGDHLFARGVSDSKFQLLNALLCFDGKIVNVLVDGAEECGGNSAGEFLRSAGATSLIIIDGTAEHPEQVYRGLSGQLDGKITIDTGYAPSHPGRLVRRKMIQRLEKLFLDIGGMHFNLTRMNGGESDRSLTLERITVEFDLRFGPSDADAAWAFVNAYEAELRQNYPPVVGSHSGGNEPLAPFSAPIGQKLPQLDTVWVLPGGRMTNGAHQPNECIHKRQIEEHRDLILKFIEATPDSSLLSLEPFTA
jgi:acetylornithine deacetylase/succinyl-diaminopimelate desuccinylase-like protein